MRLLSTVAASMGVALENARLFDETQRLLKETERRGASRRRLSEVGRDLSSSLDLADGDGPDRRATRRTCCRRPTAPSSCPHLTGRRIRAIVAAGRRRRSDQIGGDRSRRRHHRQRCCKAAEPELINDSVADPRGIQVRRHGRARRTSG